MTHFVQLHMLTSYPPANLNRDDLGRPKTARMGGAERLRVSSQSLKRHWRTSDAFQQTLSGHLGYRTRRIGEEVCRKLQGVVEEKLANESAREIADVFANVEKGKTTTAGLVHINPEEWQAIDALVEKIKQNKQKPQKGDLDLLRESSSAVDIALFGRMLTDKTEGQKILKRRAHQSIEAACQVAHAITVHRVTVEDDYFTAVDDLNEADEDRGAGHIGETGFAAGVFYSYICVDCEQLKDNLGGDETLARRALEALTEAAAKVAPSGKQNSFGSRAFASYVLAEKGDQQPRSLAVSFLKPIGDSDQLTHAINALEKQTDQFDQVYGDCADERYTLNVDAGEGNLAELKHFVAVSC